MPWKRLRQQTYWPKLNNFWTTAHHHFQKPHLIQTTKHDTQNTLWYIITRNTWHIQLHGWIIYFAFWDWYQRTTNQSYLIKLFTSSHHPYVLLQTAAEVKLGTQLTMPKIINFSTNLHELELLQLHSYLHCNNIIAMKSTSNIAKIQN